MEDSDRKPLTGREKKIILAVLVLTALVIGAWIFAMVVTLPPQGGGML
jgi:multisubunit Na+/H+ antiporter MnhC subunit